MKKLALFCGLICIIFFLGCSDQTMHKEADVLSINKNILRGELIGNFLGSSSGSLANDVIIVGLRVEFGDEIFLFDARLRYAEVAHYENKIKLPIYWELDQFNNYIAGYLNGRLIVREYLTKNLTEKLFFEFKR